MIEKLLDDNLKNFKKCILTSNNIKRSLILFLQERKLILISATRLDKKYKPILEDTKKFLSMCKSSKNNDELLEILNTYIYGD